MSSIVKILTPSGVSEIEKVFVSELGYLMVRVYNEEQKRWITYNLGVHDENDNLFTNSIKNVGG